jgi:hypothetical protein
MAMNPRLLRPLASNRFLLDQFGGAAAAYSLRRLRNGYTGAAVRVRRSNDNAEADFRPEEITNGTLTAWTGANNGFVTTWYDQSGNGLHVTQTTLTDQPRIVNSGVLETSGGKPAINFQSSDKLTRNTTVLSSNQLSFWVVFEAANPLASSQFIWHNGNSNGVGLSATTSFYSFFERAVSDRPFGTPAAVQRIISGIRTASAGTAFVNGSGTTLAFSAANAPTGQFAIGALDGDSATLLSLLQELVLWSADQTNNRTKIEEAVNKHYGVY